VRTGARLTAVRHHSAAPQKRRPARLPRGGAGTATPSGEDRAVSDDEQWTKHLGLYAYPPEIEDGLRGRRRRRARQRYRLAHRQETREYIAQQRRREPVTAAGAVVIVLMLLGLALAGRWLMGHPSAGGGPRTSTTASAPTRPATTTTSALPVPSPTLSADLSDPTTVAKEFARHYLTRNPPVDGTAAASIGRAAPWMTPALATNLANSPDPDFNVLVSRGGVAKVTEVKVSAGGQKLPADNSVRIWRTLTVTIAVHGYTSYTQTRVFHAELMHDDAGWLVSRLLGV
jgi:hypothetical protein